MGNGADGRVENVNDSAAAGQRSTFDIVNSGYYDVMREHHWADLVKGPIEEYKDANFFFKNMMFVRGAANKSTMYLLEPMIAGGVPGAAVGVGVGGSLLAAESTIGRVLPMFKQPAVFARAGMDVGRTFIGETAYTGAKCAAVDYGVSMVADRVFGVNSTIGKTLAPNLLGTALETAGVLLCRNPKVGFAAGYIAGKVYNCFRP